MVSHCMGHNVGHGGSGKFGEKLFYRASKRDILNPDSVKLRGPRNKPVNLGDGGLYGTGLPEQIIGLGLSRTDAPCYILRVLFLTLPIN